MNVEELAIDEHLKATVVFMRENIPEPKLLGIAESLPGLARLLWGGRPQEPCLPLELRPKKTTTDQESRLHSTAT